MPPGIYRRARARHFATKPARGGETVTTIGAIEGTSNNDDFFIGLVGRARLACHPCSNRVSATSGTVYGSTRWCGSVGAVPKAELCHSLCQALPEKLVVLQLSQLVGFI